MPYIGNTPALDYISFAVQNFTVTAGTTVYTLDYSVSNENDIALYINSVAQRPGSSFAYSATGTTLTLTSATLATDTMYAVFIGRAVQTVTPAAGSVTNTMLSPSVITGQTAVTTPATDDVLLCYDTSATALRKITFANFGNAPAFSVYRNANQSVAHNTDVKIQFDVENFDTNNAFDSTTNYRFTVPTGYGGKYFFTAFVGYAALQDQNEAQIRFKKNGNDMNVFVNFQGNNGFVVLCATTVETLSAGDYVEVFAHQKSGVTEDIQGGELYTSFKGFKLIGV